MWLAIIGSIITAVIGAIATVVSTKVTNDANAKAVDDTNEANLQAVRETNQSNVEQAELAYQRSLPTAQVRALMDAGMSRAGALSSLTGGGTYTAPVLQSGSSQAKSFDYSGIAQAFQHFNNLPSNVEQLKLQKEQLEELKVRTENAKAAELRAKEQHQFDMWQKLYGKDATLKIDALASDIVSQAADKDISLDSIDSIDKLVNAFDLKNNEIWRSMPNFARSQVLEGVRLQAAENRAASAENRAVTASIDAHQTAIDAHRASEDAHRISLQDEKRIKQIVKEYERTDDTRLKSEKVQSIAANLALTIAEQDELRTLYERGDLFYKDEDGFWHLTKHGRSSANIKSFFNWLGVGKLTDAVVDAAMAIIAHK